MELIETNRKSYLITDSVPYEGNPIFSKKNAKILAFFSWEYDIFQKRETLILGEFTLAGILD